MSTNWTRSPRPDIVFRVAVKHALGNHPRKSTQIDLIHARGVCYTAQVSPQVCQMEHCEMANIKSQKKRILTNELARQRNMAIRSRMKS